MRKNYFKSKNKHSHRHCVRTTAANAHAFLIYQTQNSSKMSSFGNFFFFGRNFLLNYQQVLSLN